MRITAKIYFDNTSLVQEAVRRGANLAVRKAAADIQAHATIKAPVLTGHLRNSNHTEDIGEFESYVGNTAEYADFVNFGTRKMAARPFFTESVELVRPTFAKACLSLIKANM